MGNIYIGDPNGIARKVDDLYIGDVNGIARKVQNVYIGDANGIARQVYSAFDPVIFQGSWETYAVDYPYLILGYQIDASKANAARQAGYNNVSIYIHETSDYGTTYYCEEYTDGTHSSMTYGDVSTMSITVPLSRIGSSGLIDSSKIVRAFFGSGAGGRLGTRVWKGKGTGNIRFT